MHCLSDCEVGLMLISMVFWSTLEHWDVRSKEGLGAWTQLNNAKEEGGSHLEVSSTGQVQLDRAEKSKSNPKNVASPLTSL
ncbi:unnamed protein product [Microthlaspi erraticum]|uniref:Uncharacterized protein n=1 Tax=Microthlaspi erraticum TaxID=1685480 RepID=A0A6D2K4J1_9BRAS|nr:unnamed protein product [Microthlaspi erraticum]